MNKIPVYWCKYINKSLIALFIFTVVCAAFSVARLKLPIDTLDSSWEFGLNAAIELGLVFGRDIIFTFGPYASIYTQQYHPATDHIMVWGGLFIGIFYSILLLLLTQRIPYRWIVFYILFMVVFFRFKDAWLFSFPFLLMLLTYRLTLPESHPFKILWTPINKVLYIFLFITLGLFPLIKGSTIVNSLTSLMLCCAALFYHGKKSLSYVIVCIPIISCVYFWVIVGQPIDALPSFFITIFPFISGYTEGMSYSGQIREILLYVVTTLLIFYAIARDEETPKESRLLLFLFFSSFLFMAFKASFVRHDTHAIYALISAVIAFISINFVMKLKEKLLFIIMISSLLTFFIIDKKNINTSTETVYQSLKGFYPKTLEGIKIRLFEPGKLEAQFYARLNEIYKAFPLPSLKGTSDIYAYQQTELFASENYWRPRPVFQSYTAYTSKLLQINQQHLLGETAADNIIFRLQTIDDRFPALDDGLSWPTIINNYQFVSLKNQVIYFKKKNASPQQDKQIVIYEDIHQLGEAVVLPNTLRPLFAEIDVAPTLLNKMVSFLFKPPMVYITVTLKNGEEKEFQLIPDMGRSRFLLSPLVESTEEFSQLARGNRYPLSKKMIQSIEISPSFGNGILWKTNYSLKLIHVDLPGDPRENKY